jgi:hypothetical protein
LGNILALTSGLEVSCFGWVVDSGRAARRVEASYSAIYVDEENSRLLALELVCRW